MTDDYVPHTHTLNSQFSRTPVLTLSLSLQTHYMLKHLIVLTALLTIAVNTIAQSDFLGFGFRAGLSIAKLDGPSELGPNGTTLESFSMANGFHIGAAVNFKFTDLVGLRTEFVYSQRGTEYLYDGPSYFVLGRNTVEMTTIMGNRRQSINISNAYIDIPVLAYYKIGRIEIAGGLNSGLLVASTAGGNIDFNGMSALGTAVSPFRVNLNYNYKKDEAGEASSTTQNVTVDGRVYTVPVDVGAYYEFNTKDKNLFKPLDFGLVAGASFFLNEGLFLSIRYMHGLGDMDRNDYDVSLQSLNPNGTHIQRNDVNKSRSWQFSVGFSF
jgi:hypothetical protein